MDADEDQMREHLLHKTQRHLKELDEKYHKLQKAYDLLLHWEGDFKRVEAECVVLKDKLKHLDEECHMWEGKCHEFETKYRNMQGKCNKLVIEIKQHQTSISQHDAAISELEEKCKHATEQWKHYDNLCHELEDKCRDWESKHGHISTELAMTIEKHTTVLTGVESRCADLEHHLAETKEQLHNVREECIRIRHQAQVKCSKLCERIVHLSKIEKELRSCFSKATQMAQGFQMDQYMGDIDYEEIMTTTVVVEESYKAR